MSWEAAYRAAQQNPDVEVPDTEPRRRTTPTAAESPLEARFYAMWALLDGPPLEREFYFHPVRQWHCDFYHVSSRTIIEIEGAVWTQGRHTRGAGYIEDCRKYNQASMMGYTVLRVTSEMIQPDELEEMINYCREGQR